ncbi:MAG: hypothetical protein J0G29_00915 [Alphaproteobacteria bacterium]|nr:hypothetical protein [Alphaproteobacteria bacterium]OJV47127.1 MAG: hypothetical protein BGO28_01635 [Alphaproteobacteria bacterium 43-37]
MTYRPVSRADETVIANRIAEIYVRYPVYGYRRIAEELALEMGLKAIYPGPCKPMRDLTAYRYPYLLKGLVVAGPHHVWQMDITYLKNPSWVCLPECVDRCVHAVCGGMELEQHIGYSQLFAYPRNGLVQAP